MSDAGTRERTRLRDQRRGATLRSPTDSRLYEREGLVSRAGAGTISACYSDRDIERLRMMQRLTTDLGVNLAGGGSESMNMRETIPQLTSGNCRFTAAINIRYQDMSRVWSGVCNRRSECVGNYRVYRSGRRKPCALAHEIVQQKRHSQLDVEHILLALLKPRDGVVYKIIEKLGGDPRRCARRAGRRAGRQPAALFQLQRHGPNPHQYARPARGQRGGRGSGEAGRRVHRRRAPASWRSPASAAAARRGC